jgi:hypothetical protein
VSDDRHAVTAAERDVDKTLEVVRLYAEKIADGGRSGDVAQAVLVGSVAITLAIRELGLRLEAVEREVGRWRK